LENVEEMNKFLDAFDLPKLNQEDINHLIRSTRSDKIKEVMKSLSQKGLRTGQIYLIFKEELTPIFLKLCHKIQKKGMLPNSFYEANITLIPKPDNDTTKKDY
jgi:hypothetical protein